MAGTKFSIGSLECEVLEDGTNRYPPAVVFVGLPAEELNRALRGQLDDEGQLVIPYNCLLVRGRDTIALIDTGIGDVAHEIGIPAGQLTKSLKQAGFAPADIDLVIISHAHPDHIGGLTSSDGRKRIPVFPKARHYFWEAEWNFWTSEESLANLPEMLAGPARIHLGALRDAGLLELISQEQEIAEGIWPIPAPGHTPGHMAVALRSQGESGIFLGDAVLHELNFAHIDWVSALDAIPEMAVATRKRLLKEAATEQQIVAAFHLPTPGRLERTDGAFAFRPLEAGSAATSQLHGSR